MMQEISGRSPLVQAVQEAGHSLVRRHHSLLKPVVECGGENISDNIILNPHRLEVVTLRLTTSESVLKS